MNVKGLLLLLCVMITFTMSGSMSRLIGGDRDEHGCLPSAGYTWCEKRQECVRVWIDPCDT